MLASDGGASVAHVPLHSCNRTAFGGALGRLRAETWTPERATTFMLLNHKSSYSDKYGKVVFIAK